MKESTNLDGVFLIKPPTDFEDFRGEYIEIYNRRIYNEIGIDDEFIQDDISVSSYNVLRGIHGDQNTTKLISCLMGSFYLVVVNNDETSSQYRQWQAFTVSEKNRYQVYVPPKFGNGHWVSSEKAIFHYKQTTEYDRGGQFTINWRDPLFDIWWPCDKPLLSKRDAGVSC